MGFTQDYSNVPDWVEKPEGYQAESMVKYEGNVFIANFWASKPGEGEANENGWRLYDELYDVTSSPASAPARIIGYIPTWRKKEGFDYANAEMYRNVTHGIISFLMFSETDLGEFTPESVNDVDAIFRDVVITGHDCGTYISIALGGATDYGFLSLMERIGSNPGDPVLQKAVKNVVDFVESHGLDGVDLDLECWWDRNSDPSKDQGGRLKSDGAHPAGKGLTEFAKQLKQAMPDKVISAALFATSWYGNCYDPGLVEYVDWLGIMTYDLTGSWNQTPVGPQTALLKIREQKTYADEQQGEWPGNRKSSDNKTEPMSDNPILSVEDSLWYWTNPFFTNWQGKGQNLSRNKIAAGVPIYGYDFAYGKEPDDLSGQVAPGYKTVRYKDLLSQFPDAPTAANANIKVPGNTPRPPFVSAGGTYPYAHNIYFETPDTAVTKLNFLKSVGAQGIIIWELSNDVWEGGKSVIQALYQNSGNPATRPALPSKIKPKPKLEPWPFPWDSIGIFPDDWSESIQVSRFLQSLSTEDAQVSRSLQNAATRGLDEKLPFGISGSPAVVVYDDKLFCVHEGKDDNGYLWFFTYDGKNFSEDTKLPFGTTGAPALAEYNGQLYCVHQGKDKEGYLWVCTFDGKNWSEDTKLPFGTGTYISGRPPAALAVYQGLLYCVHEGQHKSQGDGWLWVCTFDGQNWSEDKKLGFGTSGAPALAVLGDRLICMHEGRDVDGWLWKASFNGKEWSTDEKLEQSGDKGGGYGASGPPAIVVQNDQLYAVHQGRGDDGWVWSFNNKDKVDNKLTAGGPDRYIGISYSPALALYNNAFHILHHGQKHEQTVDGWIWMASTAALPSSSSNWTVLEGENSYCYCACNSASDNKQSHASNHTMNIKAGAPYFYAVLTKDDDSSDFPTGAILTITGPDGTNYDRDLQEENQLVIMSDSSVRCLIVKDPKPGDWKMTMTVPEGVGFHCECNTVPSKDVYSTITNALGKRDLTKHLHVRNISIAGWLGVAAVVSIAAITFGASLGAAALIGAVAGTVEEVVRNVVSESKDKSKEEIAEKLQQFSGFASSPPHDKNFQTYKVTLMPYIGDLKAWRSYDPSTIDGVGVLVGLIDGQLVGVQLKSQTCEYLQPAAYTWVYTLDGYAIIYKYWDKDAPKSDYTRHSQLGSGKPVICAGEFEVTRENKLSGISTVIGMVNDASGHYKPDGGACLKYVGQKLQSLDIPTDAVQWYWHD